MTFINCGVYYKGEDVKTKRALRLALEENPKSVQFYGTSAFGPPINYSGVDVPPDVKLAVVLPNPYYDRRHYATVYVCPRTRRVMVA
jgi:hypothetical protein